VTFSFFCFFFFCQANRTGVADPIHAFSFCFWTTLSQGLPWLFIALALLYLLAGLVSVPFRIAGSFVQAITSVVAYTHIGRGGDMDDDDDGEAGTEGDEGPTD
jgi:hypothetical protein